MTQLDGLTAVTDFDRTTALIPVEARPGEFLVDFDGGWAALVGVHGGYMCALAVRGAQMDGIVVAESFHTRLTAPN